MERYRRRGDTRPAKQREATWNGTKQREATWNGTKQREATWNGTIGILSTEAIHASFPSVNSFGDREIMV